MRKQICNSEVKSEIVSGRKPVAVFCLQESFPASRRSARAGWFVALALLALAGCGNKSPNQMPPPPEVSVITAVAQPVTVYEEYVAQTEAVDTVEIRARVNGVLERQAFEDGARVKKGDLLFVIDQQPYLAALAQAKAALAVVQANHVNSKQVLDRIRPLLADHAISQQDVDSASAKEAADAASVEAAKALLKTAELNYEYTTIRASRDGVISKALIKPGGLVNASSTLMTTLYSVDPIYVNFTISEQKLLEVQRQLKRNPGEDKSKSPPFRLRLVDGSEYQGVGKLNFVDAAVDAKSGTLQVRLSVPNPERSLRPGQFVRVVVPAQQSVDAIRVPQQAVQEMQGKRSVFIVDADNKVAYREITANTRLENDWLVEGGIKPGEVVIVEGVNKVRPGAPVKPVAPGEAGKADAGKAAPQGAAKNGAAKDAGKENPKSQNAAGSGK
jgi:membrane fusion protein (multidrug efflux system)